ncbi:MAG: cation:proton antiporter [Bacteroidota bacterium]
MSILKALLGFGIVAIAAEQLARFFKHFRLPLITGFLFTGMLAGPFLLRLLPSENVDSLRFINDLSLAFIAFAAGSELYLKELRSQFRSIGANTAGQLVITFLLSGAAVYLLADYIPFMGEMDSAAKLAVAMLTGTIFVARSPASAIAVINEVRAKGPFTQTAIGVTVIKDVLVIILFAVCFSLSGTLIDGEAFDLAAIGFLLVELLVSFVLGYLLGKLLSFLLGLMMSSWLISVLTVAVGWSVYLFSHWIRDYSGVHWGHELYLEPLLICILGSFVVTNYSKHRQSWEEILHDVGPIIYIAFFTLTGASMQLDVLAGVWGIALILFVVRIVSMVIAGFVGGALGGDPRSFWSINWMPFVTQAGVGLGLATVIAFEYPAWGAEFATIIIAVIVLNQVVGPPLFKWALAKVGESHIRAQTPEFDGTRDALICGLQGQSVALARSLINHGWNVKILTQQTKIPQNLLDEGIQVHSVDEWSLAAFQSHEAGSAEAIVCMSSDSKNYAICEIAYEHFGTREIIVQLNDPTNLEKFHELGVLIVDPSTAIVSLLDHMVRSPQATSLILGREDHQDTIELEVRNPDVVGLYIREVRLPLDVIVLSINRNGQFLIPHGRTQLRAGDLVTIVGPEDELDQVALRFEE